VAVAPEYHFERVQLHNGRATLVLHYPEPTRVGATYDLTVTVTDPSRTEPFAHRLRLRVTEKK
jgi:hypothetical protein